MAFILIMLPAKSAPFMEISFKCGFSVMDIKYSQSGELRHNSRYKILKDKHALCSQFDTQAENAELRQLKMRLCRMVQNANLTLWNTCTGQMKGVRNIEHHLGMNLISWEHRPEKR